MIEYVNRYWTTPESKLRQRIMEQDESLRQYRELLTFLLSKDWYQDHLPEIRKHVAEVINIKK